MKDLKKLISIFISILFLINLSTCFDTKTDDAATGGNETDDPNASDTTGEDAIPSDMLTREDALPSYAIPSAATTMEFDAMDTFFKINNSGNYFKNVILPGSNSVQASALYLTFTALAVTSVLEHVALFAGAVNKLRTGEDEEFELVVTDFGKSTQKVDLSYSLTVTVWGVAYNFNVVFTAQNDENNNTNIVFNLTCPNCPAKYVALVQGSDVFTCSLPKDLFDWKGNLTGSGDGGWKLNKLDSLDASGNEEIYVEIGFKITDEDNRELSFTMADIDNNAYQDKLIYSLSEGKCAQASYFDASEDKTFYILSDTSTGAGKLVTKEGEEKCWDSSKQNMSCSSFTTCSIQTD